MKLVNYLLIFIFFIFTPSLSENPSGFLTWKENFKKVALKNDISEETFDKVMVRKGFASNLILKCKAWYDRSLEWFIFNQIRSYVCL